MLDTARTILKGTRLCHFSARGCKLCNDAGKLHVRLLGFYDQGCEVVLGSEDREREEKPQHSEYKQKENNDQTKYAGKHVHLSAPVMSNAGVKRRRSRPP